MKFDSSIGLQKNQPGDIVWGVWPNNLLFFFSDEKLVYAGITGDMHNIKGREKAIRRRINFYQIKYLSYLMDLHHTILMNNLNINS